eukprot:74117_1
MSTESHTRLKKLSVSTLKKKCKQLRISSQGGKSDVIERIIKHEINSNSEPIKKQEHEMKHPTTNSYDEKIAQKIKIWFESISGENIGKTTYDMFEILKKGKYLCHILNILQPNTINLRIIKKGDTVETMDEFLSKCVQILKIRKYMIRDFIEIHKHYDIVIKTLTVLSIKATKFG